MTEADYLRHERIAIKMDSGIPMSEAIIQANEELSPRQRALGTPCSNCGKWPFTDNSAFEPWEYCQCKKAKA